MIKSPVSGRQIKMGGRVWQELLKQGMVEENEEETNEVYEAETEQDAVAVEKFINRKRNVKMKNIPAKPNRGKKKVVRKGKKIKSTPKVLKSADVADWTAQCASQVVYGSMDALTQRLEDVYERTGDIGENDQDEFEGDLKDLILQRMISTREAWGENKGGKFQPKNNHYALSDNASLMEEEASESEVMEEESESEEEIMEESEG